ncbi:MAG: KTSC domain-containing protein [Burkholderiaceae bacterium]
MIQVHSSAIAAVGYDAVSRRMKITFAQGNTSYDFCGVPRRVFDEFLRAASMGGYYNDHIKDRYQC